MYLCAGINPYARRKATYSDARPNNHQAVRIRIDQINLTFEFLRFPGNKIPVISGGIEMIAKLMTDQLDKRF